MTPVRPRAFSSRRVLFVARDVLPSPQPLGTNSEFDRATESTDSTDIRCVGTS